LTDVPQFGALSDRNDRFVRDVISQLVAGEYLFSNGGRFPTLGLGPRFREVHSSDFALQMKEERTPARTRSLRKSSSRGAGSGRTDSARVLPSIGEMGDEENPVDEELFARLRDLRLALARKNGLPAYAVFKNVTLAQMAAQHPTTETELLDINGVGEKKLEKYGELFLRVLGGEDPAKVGVGDPSAEEEAAG
jgi:ATP-dependent DNA helicase RecQ